MVVFSSLVLAEETLLSVSSDFAVFDQTVMVNGNIDKDDYNMLLAARDMPSAGGDQHRDLGGERYITVLDVREYK